MSLKNLSIITVAIDDFDGLCKTIDSVGFSADVQHIIKLVPNNIDAHLLQRLYPHLEIIVSDDVGIYDAMNQALVYVQSKHLLFLNVRDIFIPGSLPLVSPLKFSKSNIVFKPLAVVSGRIHHEKASFSFFQGILNHSDYCLPIALFSTYKFNLLVKSLRIFVTA